MSEGFDLFEEGNCFTETTTTAVDKNEQPMPVINSSVEPNVVAENIKDDGIPVLRGSGYPEDFISMTERIQRMYRMFPILNYDELYKELRDLSVQSAPTPTLQVLNDEIQKVQAAKDRLSEIYMEVVKHYHFKSNAIKILQESWGKFTSEKNAEGRKGDAAFRLSNFSLDFAQVESMYRACMNILRNLDSAHDTLSRRITVIQLTMKLHDVGRGGSLPDYDFVKRDEVAEENVDPNLSLNANETNF